MLVNGFTIKENIKRLERERDSIESINTFSPEVVESGTGHALSRDHKVVEDALLLSLKAKDDIELNLNVLARAQRMYNFMVGIDVVIDQLSSVSRKIRTLELLHSYQKVHKDSIRQNNLLVVQINAGQSNVYSSGISTESVYDVTSMLNQEKLKLDKLKNSIGILNTKMVEIEILNETVL